MDGDKYYIPCTVQELDLVHVRELQNPSLFDPNYSLNKYQGTVSFIRYNHLQLFNKCLLHIFKAGIDEQDIDMIRILKIDRNLSGFNIPIFLCFTSCCVDSFITESEIQRSQPAPANQTPPAEHSDSIKLHPANQTRRD